MPSTTSAIAEGDHAIESAGQRGLFPPSRGNSGECGVGVVAVDKAIVPTRAARAALTPLAPELASLNFTGCNFLPHSSDRGSHQMTDAEKNVVKEMNQIMCDLTVQIAVYRKVLKRHVANWQEEVAAAKASTLLQAFAQHVENGRQGIDLLIEQNNLSLVRSKLSKGGLED